MRVVFMGTPEAAVPSLRAVDSTFEIVAVYTRPDRPRGRGLRLEASPVKLAALDLGLEVEQPRSLKTEVERVASLEPDVIAVVAYGALLRPAVLEIPKLGCVNVHFSLLPRWRGAAPVERAILAGDEVTGVTTMLMDEGLDTGPMLLREEIRIMPADTSATLRDRLADSGAHLLVATLRDLGTIEREPQDDTLATFAPKVDASELELDPRSATAAELARKVRALPGSYLWLDGKRLKVWQAAVEPGDGEAGALVDGSLQTIDGRLRLIEVQPEGKRRMPADAFLRGRRV